MMTFLEKKNLERNFFKNLRNESLLIDRKNVEANVKLYLDSLFRQSQNESYIAIYWPLKNEVDIRSLRDNFSVALPRCEKNKMLSFYSWDETPLYKDFEGILCPKN